MSYYDEYVGHMLRTYYAEIAPAKLSEIALRNCAVVDGILSGKSDQENIILREVFAKPKRTPLHETVRKCAVNHQMTELDVWRMVRAVSREIALERGLIDEFAPGR